MSGKQKKPTEKSDSKVVKDVTKGAKVVGNIITSSLDTAVSITKSRNDKQIADINRLAEIERTKGIIEKAGADKHIADKKLEETKDTNQKNHDNKIAELKTEEEKIKSQKECALDKNAKDLAGIQANAQAEVDKVKAEAEVKKQESTDKKEIELAKIEAMKQVYLQNNPGLAYPYQQPQIAGYANQPSPAMLAYPQQLQIAGYPNQSVTYLMPSTGTQQPNYHHSSQNVGYPPPPAFNQPQLMQQPFYGAPQLPSSMPQNMFPQVDYSYPQVSTAGGTPLSPLPGQQAHFNPPIPSMPGANPQMQMMNAQGANPMMGMQSPPQPGMVAYQGPSSLSVNPGMAAGGFFNHQRQNYIAQQQHQMQLPGPGNIPSFQPH